MSRTRRANGHLTGVSPTQRSAEQGDPARHVRLKRVTMAAATAFLAVNIWTGAPLLALWVGSRVVGRTVLSMKAVLVVLLVLAALVFAMAVALTWLNNTYDELIGRPRIETRASWLRSMRAESEGYIHSRVGTTALERIVMVSVTVCVITMLIWFCFLAGSPLPH